MTKTSSMDLDRKHTKTRIAIWAVTPRGAELSRKLAALFPSVDIHLSSKLKNEADSGIVFHRLADAVSHAFRQYQGHIFVMATGIVVRTIAPLIQQKTVDPAVVVMDETGRYAISLLSGHIGGANQLARKVARAMGAEPVITTATDLNRLPAVDVLATESGLMIENPEAIKGVHMAILCGEKITCTDPFGLICHHFKNWTESDAALLPGGSYGEETAPEYPGILVSDTHVACSSKLLVLRPRSLAAGIGCNRNTPMAEIKESLLNTIQRFGLAPASLSVLASIRIKSDEPGLLALAEDLRLPLAFFDKNELETVPGVQNPSVTVEKHVGVKSVCEAAAILAAESGKLIVPKQVTKNVTVAIARRPCISSVSDPAVWRI
jgi:cobalt-precorrin 5A hydrolase